MSTWHLVMLYEVCSEGGTRDMSKTVVRKNESLEDALRRFKRDCFQKWKNTRGKKA